MKERIFTKYFQSVNMLTMILSNLDFHFFYKMSGLYYKYILTFQKRNY